MIVARPLTEAEKDDVKRGFDTHTANKNAPPFVPETFCLVAEDDQGSVQGTAYGDIVWDWMYVSVLYVDEAARGQDLGTKLMREAENLARGKGLVGIYLTTQDWQAMDFYPKLGFEAYAVIDDFPKGFKRYCFRKYL